MSKENTGRLVFVSLIGVGVLIWMSGMEKNAGPSTAIVNAQPKSAQASNIIATGTLATWTEMSGLTGGPVPALTQANGVLYAGTGKGVFKSVDDGISWADTGLPTGAVSALVADPLVGDVYAGTDEANGGVFRLAGGAGNWVKVNAGLPSDYNVKAPAVISFTMDASGTVYAALHQQAKVYKLPRGGTKWVLAPTTGIPAISPQFGYQLLYRAPRLWACGKASVAYLTDGATAWTPTAPLPSAMSGGKSARDTCRDFLIDSAGIAYVGTFHGASDVQSGLVRSTDNGATWTNMSFVNKNVQALAENNGRIFAVVGDNGEIGSLWYSDDFGVTWSSVPNLDLSSYRASLMATNAGTLLMGSMGLMRSGDNGATWEAITNGIQTPRSVQKLLNTGVGNVYGTFSGNYPARTFDLSVWVDLSGCSNCTGLGVQKLSYPLGLNASSEVLMGGVDRSYAYVLPGNGANWYRSNKKDTWGMFDFGLTSTGTTILDTGWGGICYSPDGGRTYQTPCQQPTSSAGQSGITFSMVKTDIGTPPVLWIGPEVGGMFESQNDGATWINHPLSGGNPWALGLAPDGSVLVGKQSAAHIYRWTGSGFVVSDTGIPNRGSGLLVSQIYRNPQKTAVFAATNQGVFVSTSTDGSVWAPFDNAHLPLNISANTLTEDPITHMLFVGGETFGAYAITDPY